MAQRAARLKSGVDVDGDFGRNAAPPETGRRRIASDRDRPAPENPGGGSRGSDPQCVHDERDNREELTVQVTAAAAKGRHWAGAVTSLHAILSWSLDSGIALV
jgi:hypothetical protein